jgi:hypothetical protein
MSTGPKTAERIERIRQAVTKHGRYSKRAKAERAEYQALLRACREVFGGTLGETGSKIMLQHRCGNPRIGFWSRDGPISTEQGASASLRSDRDLVQTLISDSTGGRSWSVSAQASSLTLWKLHVFCNKQSYFNFTGFG